MNRTTPRTTLHILPLLLALCALTMAPLPAAASRCSLASTAGSWAYTYTGTVFTLGGPLPGASVGHYQQDSSGNIAGSQTRSLAGDAAAEDISGTISLNKDCTGTATINVYVDGQLQRTAVIALVYDGDQSHVRMIFQSLTLPDGTNVPVVLTIDGNRLTSKH